MHVPQLWLLLLASFACAQQQAQHSSPMPKVERIVATLHEYNACAVGDQYFGDPQQVCGTVAKCYGRRLVLNVRSCSFSTLAEAEAWIKGLCSPGTIGMVEEDQVFSSSNFWDSLLGEKENSRRQQQQQEGVVVVEAQIQNESDVSGMYYHGGDGTDYLAGGGGALLPWNLRMLNVLETWNNLSTYGEKSTVAVLDSGIAYNALPAFSERIIMQGYDFISDDALSKDGDGRDADFYDPGDADAEYCPGQQDSWHGTKVASVLGANYSGFLGVAPAVNILPVRVLGRCRIGFASDVADAIVWAAGGHINGLNQSLSSAQIIVMAFAGIGSCPSFMQTAVDLALSNNISLYAAAGNNPLLKAHDFFPANCRGVVSVGALNWRGEVASYSSRDADLYMPGGDAERGVPCLFSTAALPLSGIGSCIGTSIAVPHAAGLAALGGRSVLLLSSANLGTEGIDFYTQLLLSVEGMQSMQQDTVLKLPSSMSMSTSTCAILVNGGLKCWGYNAQGQLGLGDTANRGDGANEMGNFLDYVSVGINNNNAVSQVALGSSHTCAILASTSQVKCWGQNSNGQLGNGATGSVGDSAGEMGNYNDAVNLGTGRTAKQVAAGYSHTCALLDNNFVKCWGSNGYGQLGLGDNVARGDGANEMGNSLPLVNLGTGRTAAQIVTGNYHTCALLDTSQVKCWGYNNYGQLGLGDTANRGDGANEMGDSLPVANLGTGRTAKQVAAGYEHTCALLDNNLVKCWGQNSYGQLGIGDTFARGDGANEMGDSLPVVNLGTGRTAKQISVGDYHSCAILDNNLVKCWGLNNYGQLGLGDTANRGDAANEMGDALPVASLGTGRTGQQIAAGDSHTCALLDNSFVKCWGNNAYGQLGLGNTVSRGNAANQMGDNLLTAVLSWTFMPAAGAVLSSMEVQSIVGSVAGDHTCAILQDAQIKCWGINADGQLGMGDTANRGDGANEMGNFLVRVDLGAGRTAKQLSLGGLHTCAVLDTAQVKCWGKSSTAQLGYGDTLSRGDAAGEMGSALPTVSVGTGRTVKQIAAGYAHTCALLDNALVKCWGQNGYGVLATVADTTTYPALAVIGDAAAEMGDSLQYAQLGDGMTVKQITSGDGHMCAILDNDNVKCWGVNTYGQLGIASATDQGSVGSRAGNLMRYAMLGTGRTAKQISAGRLHTCAILDNNFVKCWGHNNNGQLGIGVSCTSPSDNIGDGLNEMGDSLPYVNLGTGRTAKQVAAGYAHTCAILDNDQVKCWGSNAYGQLGIEITGSSKGCNVGEMGDWLRYVNLGTGRTAKSISAGQHHTCAVLDDNTSKCWGRNLYGQLGIGSSISDRGRYENQMGDFLAAIDLGTFDCFACASGQITVVGCTALASAATCISCACSSFWDGTSCVQCPAGTFSPGGNSTSCTPCAVGTYYNRAVSSAACQCTSCAADTSTASSGSSSAEQCLPIVSRLSALRAYPVSALSVDSATGQAVVVGQAYGNGNYNVSGYNLQNLGNLLDGDAATYAGSVGNDYTNAGAYAKTKYLADPSYPGEWIQIFLPSYVRLSHISITRATGRPTGEAPKDYRVYGYVPAKGN